MNKIRSVIELVKAGLKSKEVAAYTALFLVVTIPVWIFIYRDVKAQIDSPGEVMLKDGVTKLEIENRLLKINNYQYQINALIEEQKKLQNELPELVKNAAKEAQINEEDYNFNYSELKFKRKEEKK